jgi:thiol:disulfide interchange protein/DsbC/DsbD-like thiol-disulfide interchange protein
MRRPFITLLQRAGLGAAFAATLPAAAQLPGSGAVVTTDQVRAELVAHAPEGVTPGKALLLGLKIEHKPQWHTYWLNPGDSGLPTTLEWTLPAGFAASDIAWPTPKKLPVGPMVNYGYEGTLLLPVSVEVPASFAASSLPVKLQAQWLVCKDVCIPEQGSFSLDVPARAATAVHGASFDAARRAQPAAAGGVTARAAVKGEALDVELSGMPAAWHGKNVDFFAELAGVIDHAARVAGQWQGATWKAIVPLSRERTESPASMHAVLTMPGQAAGLRVALDIKGAWPSVAGTPDAAAAGATPTATTTVTPGARATAPSNTPPAPSALSMTLWFALVSALLGGLLLNLMPCVLPVLSLKALGLAKHDDNAARVGSGLAYTAGVLMAFLALAGVLIALRDAGEAVGWGFQLQSPPVVAALAALFTLIGLNLAGVFELGMALPGDLAAARPKHPWVDAWLTGVLAVAVAAPCTAPFMGAALGYAAGLPAAQALLVFAALGLGLALPFLLLSLSPRLARWLPKPGAWMQRFKVAMAFPMFATVVWLVWVLGQQSGIDAAAALLAVLVALAFAAWTWGARAQGMGRVWSAIGAALAAVALVWAWPMWREVQAAPQQAATASAWQPWAPGKVEAELAAGRSVFVDFTAAWCVSCQVNKRTTLDRAEVQKAFDAHKVVRMRADWTRRDAAIAAELTKLGRNGVPVYALYRPGASAPVLLPELLTTSVVLDALAAPSH